MNRWLRSEDECEPSNEEANVQANNKTGLTSKDEDNLTKYFMKSGGYEKFRAILLLCCSSREVYGERRIDG